MKISIVTPSFNSADTIERAIKSVLAQGYDNFEHIIKDGGSTDGTIDILKQYPHLKWVSETDRNQIHAMNQGFSMATGDIVSYLNADDYYWDDAFSSVTPHFKGNVMMVMGKVLVRSEKADGVREWTNDPAVDFRAILRHWQPNSFCVNPVGYFYKREVQEKIPYREESGGKMDLEFLMEAALQFEIKKINKVLGVFEHDQKTRTAREQMLPSYWRPENFAFVDRLAANLPEEKLKQFRLERDRGYQLRRQWTAREAFAHGMVQELFKKNEALLLPEDETDCAQSRCGFVEHDRLGTSGDWIIPVLSIGKCGTKSIHRTLKSLNYNTLPAQVYHVHMINEQNIYSNLPSCIPQLAHPSVGLALNHLFNCNKENLTWKFIAGVREPISRAISGIFTVWPDIAADKAKGKIKEFIDIFEKYFFGHYKDIIGINILEYPFQTEKGFSIIKKENVELFVYRLENLSNIFTDGMEEYLGIPALSLKTVNVGENDSQKKEYKMAKTNIRLDKEFLQDVYSSSLVKHFYSKDEIDSFIEKWAREPKRYTPAKYNQKKQKGGHSPGKKKFNPFPKYFCIDPFSVGYLSIPKNACTSLKIALAKLNDPQILEKLENRLPEIHKDAPKYFDASLTLADDEKTKKQYFSFTFVRDPYTRFMSFYRNKIYYNWDAGMDKYMRSKGFYPKMAMEACLDTIASMPVFEMNEHFVPQIYFVFNDNKSNIDFWEKTENMRNGLAIIEQKIEARLDVPNLNVTSDKTELDLTGEVKEKIQKIYADDFVYFEYEM